MLAHDETPGGATQGLPTGRSTIDEILDDYRTAAIDEGLRSTLAFLERLTLDPHGLSGSDVRVVLDAGVTAEQLRDAIHVGSVFQVYDRLADALAWDVPATPAFDASARHLLTRGYL